MYACAATLILAGESLYGVIHCRYVIEEVWWFCSVHLMSDGVR